MTLILLFLIHTLLVIQITYSQRQSVYTETHEVIRQERDLPQEVCNQFPDMCRCGLNDPCFGCVYTDFFDTRGAYFQTRTHALSSFPSVLMKWDPPARSKDNLNSQNLPVATLSFGTCRRENVISFQIDIFFSFNPTIPTSIYCRNCHGIYAGNSVFIEIHYLPIVPISYRTMWFEVQKIKFLRQRYAGSNDCCVSRGSINMQDGCPHCQFRFTIWANGQFVRQSGVIIRSLRSEMDTNLKFFVTDQATITKSVSIVFSLVDSTSRRLIDKVTHNDYSEVPFRPKRFVSRGEFQNVELNLTIQSHSYFRGGNNAFKACDYGTFETTCNSDGDIICANPIFTNPPFCTAENTPCNRNPCLNQGRCNGTTSYYKCNCLPGFIGKNCEKSVCVNDCHNSECVSPNQCGPCIPGWTGRRCDERTCTGFTRCRTGICTIVRNEIRCNCNNRTSSGTHCQFICSPPCVNGICESMGGRPFCRCDRDWFGKSCNRQTESNQLLFARDGNFYTTVGCIAGIGLGLILIISLMIVYVNNKKEPSGIGF